MWMRRICKECGHCDRCSAFTCPLLLCSMQYRLLRLGEHHTICSKLLAGFIYGNHLAGISRGGGYGFRVPRATLEDGAATQARGLFPLLLNRSISFYRGFGGYF